MQNLQLPLGTPPPLFKGKEEQRAGAITLIYYAARGQEKGDLKEKNEGHQRSC